jgi:hypothetical protein
VGLERVKPSKAAAIASRVERSKSGGQFIEQVCSAVGESDHLSSQPEQRSEADRVLDAIALGLTRGQSVDDQLGQLARVYPSLAIAKLAARVSPRAAHAISRFTQSARERVPAWLQKAVVEGTFDGKPPPTLSLHFDPELPDETPYAKLPSAGYIDPRGTQVLERASDTYGDAHSAGVLRIAAAMVEQGQALEVSQSALLSYADNLQSTLPNARLLARACIAFGIPFDAVSFGGVQLTEWTRDNEQAGMMLASREWQRCEARHRLFVGKPALRETTRAQLAKWIESDDPRWLDADSAAFDALSRSVYDGREPMGFVDSIRKKLKESVKRRASSTRPEDHRKLLNALYNAERLLGSTAFVSEYVKAMPIELLEDPRMADLFVEVWEKACPCTSAESAELRGGGTLEDNPSYRRADERRRNRELGLNADCLYARGGDRERKPLGWTTSALGNALGRAELFQWSDNAFHNAHLQWGCPRFEQFVDAYPADQRASVFHVLARLVELASTRRTKVDPTSRALEFLSKPVPVPDKSAHTLGALARLADAAFVPLGRVRVEHEGRVEPLGKIAGFEGRDRTDAALRAVKAFAAAGPDEASIREGLSALFPSGEPFELGEILAAALADPDFSPVDLKAIEPDARIGILRDALASYHHPGVIMALAGTLFRGFSAAQLRSVLAELGYDSKSARVWSTNAYALSHLDPRARAFALREIAFGKPDLPLLALQIAFSRPSMSASQLESTAKAFSKVDAYATVRAMLDRATMLGAPSLPIVDALRKLVKQKTLPSTDVRFAFEGHPLCAQVAKQFAGALETISRAVELKEADLNKALSIASPFISEEELLERGLFAMHEAEVKEREAIEANALSDEALLTLADAFHQGLVSYTTLNSLARTLPLERTSSIIERTPHKDARDAIRGRTSTPKMLNLKGASSPTARSEVSAPKIQRGLSAPKPSEET